jgi:hypothetical protein
LTLEKILKEVQIKDEFLKGDRDHQSFKLDIVLRYISEYFNKTEDFEKLPHKLLGQIFDHLSLLLKDAQCKSSNLSHLGFLAFAIKYDNPVLFKQLDDKIKLQKCKPGRVFNAKTLRNYLTIFAYGDYKFSNTSWLIVIQHF